MTCEGNVCGTGGWGGPKPGDPDNTSSVLSATPAFGGIDIRWNYPNTNPHAVSHVVLYRSIINDFNATIIRERVTGEFFYDKVEPNVVYFYWIRIVSINGTVGEPIGPASAAARPSIEGMIELLTGHIDAGVLAQSLKTEIARIPEIDTRIIGEIGDRISSNQALIAALDAVSGDLDQALTLVANEVTQRTEGDMALVSAVNTIAAGSSNNAAAIVEERNVRVSADSALGQRIDTMYAELNTAADTKISAAIQSERTVRVNAEGALASSIDALHVQIGTDIQGAIQTETNLRVAADNALGTRIDTMAITVGQNSAAIQNEATVRTNAISAETSNRNTQYASVQPAINAAVASEASLRDGAIGTAIGNEINNRNSAITAAVLQETNARAAADGALAQNIVDAEARANGQAAAVETRMSASIGITNGKVTAIGALYTAKVTVNGLIGGFGIYNDGTEVQAGFDVDTFWVGRTAANKRKPFIIVGGETFIDQAVINQLTFSKLRSDDGSTIVENGKLKAAFLQVDNAQSTSFVAGSAGWQLQNSGYAEFNNVMVRGSSVFQGLAQNAGGTNFVNFNATGSQSFIKVGGNIDIRADGSGFFARSIVSAPNIIAQGTAYGSWGVGSGGSFNAFIDTGIDVGGDWTTAATDMYSCTATISGGTSSNGGITGYGQASVSIGDGLNTSYNGVIDNRIYIKYAFNAGSGGSFTASQIQWKLVRI